LVKDAALCRSCYWCADNCPALAIELKGEEISPEALCAELIKDKVYFEKSGGGVTLSGGEPVMHYDYALALLKLLKQEGVSVALDTAGCYPWEKLEGLLSYVDLVLFDIKIFDSAKHREATGADNAPILENAKKLSASGTRIWVRTPIIPGATDGAENIESIGAFIKQYMPNIEKWELLSFNNLAKSKYQLLGKKWAHADTGLIEKEYLQQLCALAGKYTDKACSSGATRLEVADNES
jgi:pyruvate formate lyase activating enzyme